jgi:hypothetical protein
LQLAFLVVAALAIARGDEADVIPVAGMAGPI